MSDLQQAHGTSYRIERELGPAVSNSSKRLMFAHLTLPIRRVEHTTCFIENVLFREPVNGYVFEVIDSARNRHHRSLQPRTS